MPAQMKRYDLLFSCPSDMQRQMQNIEGVITDVNRVFESDGFYFSFKHWSKDVLIEFGTPQVKINNQIVNDADAVVALFGTKLGTPTAKHESGTVEEITIFAKQHKQVFVFFSNNINSNTPIKEIRRVQNFKKEYGGIYKEFDSDYDLKVKLYDQLILYGNKLKSKITQRNRANGEQNYNVVVLKKYVECMNNLRIIHQAQSEIFISGCSLSGWTGNEYIDNFLSRADIRIRILVTDTTDDILVKAYEGLRGHPHTKPNTSAFKRLLAHPNIEIRKIGSIMPVVFAATDMDTDSGYIRAHHLFNKADNTKTITIELDKTNKEWFDIYKGQIDTIWAQGTLW